MTYRYTTPDDVATAGERSALESFLDHYRAVMCDKVRGTSDDDARRRLVPSLTTLAGLLKHLSRVEAAWFQRRLAQRPTDEIPVLKELEGGDPDADFIVLPDDTVAVLIDEYEQQCAVSRAIAVRFELDDVVPHPRLGEISLRWIYLHMIEETARHVGHADILREQIDGAVGD